MTAASIATAQGAPMRISITPSGRKWRASFNDETLCVSASPLIKSARILIAKGVDPNRTIEMWHQHAHAWSLRGQLGAVAATLIDGETAFHPAKNSVPADFSGMAVIQCRRAGRALIRDSQGRPSGPRAKRTTGNAKSP